MDKKNDDCYFYYYSNCTKGSSCPFRHEPLARGKEEVCDLWEYGRCVKKNCNKRHMVIAVKRSDTLCYWESQPSGCQKPHCVFKHTKKRPAASVEKRIGDGQKTETEGVPSPVVAPVLISFSETDTDESPVKPSRIKPVIADSGKVLAKKISLKDVKNSIGDSSTEGPSISNRPKTLRERKREKILKAKLEQQKKLQALKSADAADQSKLEARIAAETRTQDQSASNGGQTNASDINLQNDATSTKSQVAGVSDLKIKTFEEIMAEKRKRKKENEEYQTQPPVKAVPTKIKRLSSTNSDDPPSNGQSRTPIIIPARKMKVRSTRRQQTSEDSRSESASLAEQKILEKSPEVKSVAVAEMQKTTSVSDRPVLNTRKSVDNKSDILDDDDDVLYDSKTADGLLDIHMDDDEKLFNEMEELLA